MTLVAIQEMFLESGTLLALALVVVFIYILLVITTGFLPPLEFFGHD
jgi:hypothetical protein